MKKPSLLFFLILILAFLASVLIFWRLLIYQAPVSKPTPTPTLPVSPTPVFQPTPTPQLPPETLKEGKGEPPEEILDSLKKKFPLIEFLPYETNNFSVDYIAPLHLQVRIKNATFSAQIKQEATNWIKSHGIDPSTHKIDWVIPGP